MCDCETEASVYLAEWIEPELTWFLQKKRALRDTEWKRKGRDGIRSLYSFSVWTLKPAITAAQHKVEVKLLREKRLIWALFLRRKRKLLQQKRQRDRPDDAIKTELVCVFMIVSSRMTHLLRISPEHWIYDFDPLEQVGGNHIRGSATEERHDNIVNKDENIVWR